MFFEMQNGALLNITQMQDCFTGIRDKNIVILKLIKGITLYEYYETEQEAKERVKEIKEFMDSVLGGLVQRDTLSDFPDRGNKGSVYIAKDTGQTYYWDPISETYITTGTAGRTGVYQWDKDIPSKIGQEVTIPKNELDEVLKASVDYMNGSTVIGIKGNTGIIIKSDTNTVTIKTTFVQTTDSFMQVPSESDLPAKGTLNVLYYLIDTDEFRI